MAVFLVENQKISYRELWSQKKKSHPTGGLFLDQSM